MADMLVNLAALPDVAPILAEQKSKGVKIRRGQPDEKDRITEWVREFINPNWVIGCEVALEQEPATCFVAVETDKTRVATDNPNDSPSEIILGFACYDVVTEGVFGPTGVRGDRQDSGIDTALLLTCLHEMAALNYERAVIGWSAFIEGNNRTDWSDNPSSN